MRKDEVGFEEFERLDIRVGKIISAEDFPKARKPAYKLTIDFGELGIKRSSAQITGHYAKEALIGKSIVAVVNFPPRQIADFFSEVLVLGVKDETGKVVLLMPEHAVTEGLQVS